MLLKPVIRQAAAYGSSAPAAPGRGLGGVGRGRACSAPGWPPAQRETRYSGVAPAATRVASAARRAPSCPPRQLPAGTSHAFCARRSGCIRAQASAPCAARHRPALRRRRSERSAGPGARRTAGNGRAGGRCAPPRRIGRPQGTERELKSPLGACSWPSSRAAPRHGCRTSGCQAGLGPCASERARPRAGPRNRAPAGCGRPRSRRQSRCMRCRPARPATGRPAASRSCLPSAPAARLWAPPPPPPRSRLRRMRAGSAAVLGSAAPGRRASSQPARSSSPPLRGGGAAAPVPCRQSAQRSLQPRAQPMAALPTQWHSLLHTVWLATFHPGAKCPVPRLVCARPWAASAP